MTRYGTETWLSDGIPSAYFFDQSLCFTVHRMDRPSDPHGGVLHARIQELSPGGGGGGPGQSDIFCKVPEEFQHFPGGSNFFQGGGWVQLLIPYRNPYNL